MGVIEVRNLRRQQACTKILSQITVLLRPFSFRRAYFLLYFVCVFDIVSSLLNILTKNALF